MGNTTPVAQQLRGGRFTALFLSIDAKKALDRVNWGFMMETIEVLGLGPRLTQWI